LTQDFHTSPGHPGPDNATWEEFEFMGSAITMSEVEAVDPLLTAEDVALRLKVSKDWVWDHSSRRLPYLPVIRMSDGALRYRASKIEQFINERERLAGSRYLRR
jgi:predicted DNA-binding transcriptional regulator AlpA